MTSNAATRKLRGSRALTLRMPELRHALAALSLAGIVVTGAVLAAGSSPHRSFLLPVSRGRAPEAITGPLAEGFGLTGEQFLLFLVLMGGFYGAFLVWGRHLSARWTMSAIGVLVVLFAVAPPILSKDIFSYVAYARMGVDHGVDPYLHGPAIAPHDPVFAFVGWRHAPTAYGPLFTLGSYALAPLGVAGAMWMLKAIAAASALGTCALIWRCAGQRRLAQAPAVALFGLNPMVLVYAVGGGHNDLLLLLLLTGGVALCLNERPAAGAAGAVAATLTKATAAVTLPFFLLGAADRRRGLIGGLAAAVAGLAVATVAFPDHALGVLRVLRHESLFVSAESVPTELSRLFGAETVTPAAHLIAALALLAGLAYLVVRVWRGMDWIAGAGWALALTLVTSSWLLGWYTIWTLPFAALARDRRLKIVALAICAYYVLGRWNIFIGAG
ncbi:MAG TPA: glycosyltransferase 87 family protein [Thermoleophilaceae bacterium]